MGVMVWQPERSDRNVCAMRMEAEADDKSWLHQETIIN